MQEIVAKGIFLSRNSFKKNNVIINASNSFKWNIPYSLQEIVL